MLIKNGRFMTSDAQIRKYSNVSCAIPYVPGHGDGAADDVHGTELFVIVSSSGYSERVLLGTPDA